MNWGLHLGKRSWAGKYLDVLCPVNQYSYIRWPGEQEVGGRGRSDRRTVKRLLQRFAFWLVVLLRSPLVLSHACKIIAMHTPIHFSRSGLSMSLVRQHKAINSCMPNVKTVNATNQVLHSLHAKQKHFKWNLKYNLFAECYQLYTTFWFWFTTVI